MSNIDLGIGIGAEYKGRAAFQKAETATQKLTKSVRNLAGAFGIAFGARAVGNFAKVSLRAFQESEAQQQRLARLLEVTTGASEAQIDVLTRQADALEQLGVVSAGNITQVQSQLATFDLQILTINRLTPAILDYVTAEKGAAASADEFKAATNGLAQALNGNFASLTKTGFNLTEVQKKMISTGTEAERTAAIVEVLNGTYKGFNRSLRDTPAGQFALLANAADDARVIIGDGLTTAITTAFGGGDIDEATKTLKDMSNVVSDIIQGLGTMTGWLVKIGKWSASNSNKAIAARETKANAPFDPMSMKVQDLSPAFMQLVKEQKKLDAVASKADKDRLAREKKRTEELRKQNLLKKANAILDKAETIFNMDLIQNTAALQGKITEDESLRLRLQRDILLGNSDAAAKLAQELLSVQMAAMMAASVDPFGNYAKSAIEAMKALQELRNGLATLGTPSVISPDELLARDYADVLKDAVNPEFAMLDGILGYQDAFARPNAGAGFTPTEVRIFIDPSAAAYGINAAVVGANANGTSSTLNRNGVFGYGGQ
jgi:hypothetical protein